MWWRSQTWMYLVHEAEGMIWNWDICYRLCQDCIQVNQRWKGASNWLIGGVRMVLYTLVPKNHFSHKEPWYLELKYDGQCGKVTLGLLHLSCPCSIHKVCAETQVLMFLQLFLYVFIANNYIQQNLSLLHGLNGMMIETFAVLHLALIFNSGFNFLYLCVCLGTTNLIQPLKWQITVVYDTDRKSVLRPKSLNHSHVTLIS